MPFAQHYHPDLVITARTSGDSAAAARLIQTALDQSSPGISAAATGPGRPMLLGPFAILRAVAFVAVLLGGLTLLMASIGLYALEAQLVQRRTRELGVRAALGADRSTLYRMVVREGLRPVGEGVAIGVMVGVLLRLGIRLWIPASLPLLSPAELVLAIAVPLAAGLLACWVPARRAAGLSPAAALRE